VAASPTAQEALAVINRYKSGKTPFRNALETTPGRQALSRDLLGVLEKHHAYTAGHVQRVGAYSRLLGEAIGMRGPQLETLELGAVLHDIGKTAVPKQILQKEGALTEREFEIMKHHTTIGADTLLGHVPELKPLLNMIRQHHERPAGGGYPLGLKSAEIDPMAKIVTIADTFDAMTSTRSYRPGMPVEKAKDIMRKAARNGQLDGGLVEVFIRALEFRRGGKVIPVAERFREVGGKAS
jgi:HD-GYP domain-containing protein (c-di-GMP phosphodiesterase class II)